MVKLSIAIGGLLLVLFQQEAPAAAIDAPAAAPALTNQDLAILNGFHDAQGRQGSLDGGWIVAAAAGGELYRFQFTDPGAGESRIEGAWRRLGDAGASGFIDGVAREGELVVRFTDAPGPAQLRLQAEGSAAWRGELVSGETRTPVVMSRAAGLETTASAAPRPEPAPKPAATKAAPRPAPKRAPATKRRR